MFYFFDFTVANNNEIVLTKWLQVTVSKITIKLYASTQEDDHEQSVLCMEDGTITESEELKLCDLKLVFDAEDVTTSIDVHPEYFKLKSKIVTGTIHHYIRYSFVYCMYDWFSFFRCSILEEC